MAINKTNAAAYLPFVQALAAGQKVLHKSPTTGNWYVPKGGFVFDADPSQYCIGTPPAPEVWKVVVRNTETGKLQVGKRDFANQADAAAFNGYKAKFQKVSVIRVS